MYFAAYIAAVPLAAFINDPDRRFVAEELGDTKAFAVLEAVNVPRIVTVEVELFETAADPLPAVMFPVIVTVAPPLVILNPNAFPPVELKTSPVAFNVPFPDTVIPIDPVFAAEEIVPVVVSVPVEECVMQFDPDEDPPIIAPFKEAEAVPESVIKFAPFAPA